MTFCDIYEICGHVNFCADSQMLFLILKDKMLWNILVIFNNFKI